MNFSSLIAGYYYFFFFTFVICTKNHYIILVFMLFVHSLALFLYTFPGKDDEGNIFTLNGRGFGNFNMVLCTPGINETNRVLLVFQGRS